MVNYALSQDDRGRPRATNVTYLVARPTVRERRAKSQGPVAATLLASTFLALVAAAVGFGALPWPVMWVYVLASVVTYAAYANDKRAAQAGSWRTKEGTLLMLGLAGGWPGGLIAQRRLRHKTKKVSFQVAFWLTVGLNCAALMWLRAS